MDGEVTAEWIAHKVKPYLSQRDIRLVCEWGMGMGRLIRNFPLHFSSARIVGYDYNDEYVECCKMNYQGISFYTNQLMPPLPKCSESSIDLLVAISIFTHLSDRSIREWFKEFAGKMAPGGVFLFTTHGHGFYQRLTANEKKMFSSGQLVEWKQGAEGKRTFASFHPKTYIRDVIPKEFELLEHNEGSLNEQDTWIVKRL